MDLFSEPTPEERIDEAIRRFEHAANRLDQRLDRHIARAAAQAGSMMDVDRASLAVALDVARGRELALEAAGAEASAALAQAIAALRARADAAEGE